MNIFKLNKAEVTFLQGHKTLKFVFNTQPRQKDLHLCAGILLDSVGRKKFLSVDNFHKSVCYIIWSFTDFLFGFCISEKRTRYNPQRRKISLDLQDIQCLSHIISVRRCPSLLFQVSKLAFHLALLSLITPAGKGNFCWGACPTSTKWKRNMV